MNRANSLLTGIIIFSLASALVFAPGCSLDELPIPDEVPVPPTDEESGTQGREDNREQDQDQDATPSAVSGEDPRFVSIYPGAVRTMYGSDGDEHAAVYAAPADPDDVVEFYEAEIEKLDWQIAQKKSTDDRFAIAAANEEGESLFVSVEYGRTSWPGYSEFTVGWTSN